MAAAKVACFPEVEKKYGLTFQYIQPASSAVSVAQLQNGEADFSISGASRVMAANSQGGDLLQVWTGAVGPTAVLVGASKDKDSAGTDLANYADKTWAYVGEGGSLATTAQKAAEASGLDWANVRKVSLPGNAAFEAALSAGQVDIISADPSTAAKLVSSGTGYIVQNLGTAENIEKNHFAYLGPVALVKGDFVSEYPALTQDIVTCLTQGLIDVQDKSATDVLKLLPAEMQAAAQAAPAEWELEWQLVQPSLQAAGSGIATPAALADVCDQQLAAKALDACPSDADLANWFPNSFVEQAYKDLGIPMPS